MKQQYAEGTPAAEGTGIDDGTDHGAEENRYQALDAWVREHLPGGASPDELTLTPLAGDAGFRRYFRLNTLPPLLAVDAPPQGESASHFVALANYLRSHNIAAPAIAAADEVRGFLLVEDFGDQLLGRELSADTAPVLYGEALMTLLALQQCPDTPELLARYDQQALRRELEYFNEWFVGGLLGCSLDASEQELLASLYTALEGSAQDQAQVLVHRDYHSRNLLVCDSGILGVVDFQDAVWGPVTYDLVSLLKDCYVRWEPDQVRRWALGYGNMAVDVGIMPATDEQTFLRWFDWMGLQRHIKVLGIFARLHQRDGKSGYLKDLPLVIRYTLETAEAYPEFRPFADWFRRRLLPLAEAQSWYRDYRRVGDAQS